MKQIKKMTPHAARFDVGYVDGIYACEDGSSRIRAALFSSAAYIKSFRKGVARRGFTGSESERALSRCLGDGVPS